jgi:tetrahydromethanopterin S-methyltransferase subunit D
VQNLVDGVGVDPCSDRVAEEPLTDLAQLGFDRIVAGWRGRGVARLVRRAVRQVCGHRSSFLARDG